MLFWSHHAFIDMVWTKWQKRNGYDYSGPGANRNAATPGMAYTVDQVMDHRKLCYEYADLADADLAGDQLPPPQVQRPSAGARPDMVEVASIPTDENARWGARDRSNLNGLRFPEQIPDSWLSMNKIDVRTCRGYEDEYRTVYRQLNSIKGYLSPCCLWKRASLCRGLVGKIKKFCVDVDGVGRMEISYQDTDPAQCLSNVRCRAEYTSPDVELPPEAYRSEIQKLVGASAFDGAGMKLVTDMDHLAGASKAAAGVLGAAAAAALVPAFMAMA